MTRDPAILESELFILGCYHVYGSTGVNTTGPVYDSLPLSTVFPRVSWAIGHEHSRSRI